MIGAIMGPSKTPSEAMATYLPRSAELTTSATMPLARAIVPLLPALCTQRRTRSAA